MDTCNLESQVPSCGSSRGGWITFPFLSVATAASGIALWGMLANLIVYLIDRFHVSNIDAALIATVVNGCASLSPLVGAILADSFGCFPVISISYCISLLATVVLTLTATLDSWSPRPGERGSKVQFAVLYTALSLVTVGIGGTRYNLATMGAKQFSKTKEQGTFFNWFFFILYASAVIGTTAVVYIEDNISWAWGFGVCVIANFFGLALFLLGNRFYCHEKAKQSPFLGLARVLVAATRKRKALLSTKSEDYHHQDIQTLPGTNLRFLNRAALKAEGDDGAKPWSLCSVEQVEDFKRLIKIVPLWSSSTFLGIPITMQSSLVILQALSMDRQLGRHFNISAGSIPVIALVSGSIAIPLIDRFLFPTWQKLTSKMATPLQRVGVGYVLTALSMGVSAVTESRRLHQLGPISALWLLPQLFLVGVAEAFFLPGQVAFNYQEFPVSLKGTSTGIISLSIAIQFYLGTALIHLLRRNTEWLRDDINKARLDNVYWMLVGVGLFNFIYFLVCANLFKSQNVDNSSDK